MEVCCGGGVDMYVCGDFLDSQSVFYEIDMICRAVPLIRCGGTCCNCGMS